MAFFLLACSPPSEQKQSDTKVDRQLEVSAQAKADLIFTNGHIYSLDWDEPDLDGNPAANAPYDEKGWHPDANSLAIADGKILFVGDLEKTLKYQSDETRMVDLKGAVAIPGLVDSHVHIAELDELLQRVNLTGVKTPDEAVQEVRKFAEKLSADDWIIGQGWDEGAWANHYPNKQLLDEFFSSQPVVLRSLHGFAIWANSMALKKAGITGNTKAPVGGQILLDKLGEPNGILLNNATNLIKQVIPQLTDKQFEETIRIGLEKMAKDGFVSVHQAGATGRHITGLQRLHQTGQLPIRVYAMLSAREEKLVRQWIQKGPMVDPQGWLDIRSVKAYFDGALGSRGARLLEDYSDKAGHKGVSGDAYGYDGELVKELMQAGFQVGIHAIGDAGNRETLDYFEQVYQQSPAIRAQRNRIEHAQIISPIDMKRLADLSIIASMEPPHAVEDKNWAEDRLGAERIKGAYAWRTLRKQNVSLTFNSDLPGSDHSIFYGLHSAITRKDKNHQPEEGWYYEQAMSAEEALRGYTNWAAYSAFREQQTGILAEGLWADITVMNIDPLSVGELSPNKILEGRILMTVVGGKIVFTADE